MSDRDREGLGEAAHAIWLAGLGALAVAEEEGSKLFSRLVEEGRRQEATGRDVAEGVRDQAGRAAGRAREAADEVWSGLNRTLDERLVGALQRLGIPSRQEVAALTARVEELTAAVEGLRSEAKAATARGPKASDR